MGVFARCDQEVHLAGETVNLGAGVQCVDRFGLLKECLSFLQSSKLAMHDSIAANYHIWGQVAGFERFVFEPNAFCFSFRSAHVCEARRCITELRIRFGGKAVKIGSKSRRELVAAEIQPHLCVSDSFLQLASTKSLICQQGNHVPRKDRVPSQLGQMQSVEELSLCYSLLTSVIGADAGQSDETADRSE